MRYDAAFDNVITETGIKPEAYLGNSRKMPCKRGDNVVTKLHGLIMI